MPEEIPADSVGIVKPHTAHFDEPLSLTSGGNIDAYDLVYETYGKLNSDKSNAILICHALSSNHHVAGYHSMDDRKPGWWENIVGPGKSVDTNRFYVVSCNNLGGCFGSSGPSSTDPRTGKAFGPDFPFVTVRDWVESQARLADRLEIKKWAAVIGGSLGGMQVMQWAIDYPDRLAHGVVIAASPKLTAQNIAFNEVARQAIRTDPEFHDGRYYDFDTVPARGLRIARMLGHITYLSDDSMREKFGRDLRDDKIDFDFDVEFQVESYLRYQADSFVGGFDANTYLLITKVLDYFDPAADHGGNLTRAMATATADFLVVSFTSDWRFAPVRSREIVKAIHDNGLNVSYAEIKASQGHDAFLMKIPHYLDVFGSYMERVASEVRE
ncbi:MAG: homoserine O-acetyltransferase [Acidiferrobacterales bacterium]